MGLTQRLSSPGLIAQARLADASTWSDIRTLGGKVTAPTKSSFGTSPGLPPSKPPVSRPPPKTTPVITPLVTSSNAPAATGPLEVKLRQQMEAMAKKGVRRSVKELVTVPELNPLYNDKSAALWKTMNHAAYTNSDGRYGVSEAGMSGSKGSLVHLYGADNLVARSKKFDAAGVGAYSILSACAAWNLNGLAGMSLAQRVVQTPLGMVRGLVNVGASQLDTSGLGNVWLETAVKGSTGAVVTVLTNKFAAKAGQIIAPTHLSWAPGAPMRKGLVVAAYSVNISLTALSEMEKLGWLGGKLPTHPTEMQKLTDVLKKGAAVGTGFFVAVGPAVWNATGGSKAKTAMAFGLPMLQFVLGNRIAGGLSEQPVRPGAAGALNGNSGNAKIKRFDAADALRNGANPFELADTSRSPTGKYLNVGQPALKIADAVLDLQDTTRLTTATPNVRTNDEAAAVIKRVLALDKAGTLPAAAKNQLRALLSNLKANDIYFGSPDVKTAAVAAFATDSGAMPSVTPTQRKFVRQVFDGSFRRGQLKKTDIGSSMVSLLLNGLALLSPKKGVPLAAVLDDLVNPVSVANDDMGRTFPGFAERINAKYGSAFAALGEQGFLGRKLTVPERRAVEGLVLESMYKAVYEVVNSRPGSATQHGSINIPPMRGANGGYFFTAFERMKPAEKTAVRTMMRTDLQDTAEYMSKTKSTKEIKMAPPATIAPLINDVLPTYRPFGTGPSRYGL